MIENVCSMPKQSTKMQKIIASCMIGNALEWYDFIIFGYFAIIIGKLFFPAANEITIILQSYGVFLAGFIMRPLGAVVFGYIGDKYSRKKALMWSIYLMAIPTTIIGCLPTYSQIGLAAPCLLIFLRLLQGLSMGGEFTGSMIFITENAPNNKRAFFGSWVPFSAVLGLIFGSLLSMTISMCISEASLASWGWRIPFVLSFAGSMVGSYMRSSIEDIHQEKSTEKRGSFFKLLFTKHWKDMLVVALIDFTVAIGFFVITVFIMSYLQKFVGFSYREAAIINSISMVAFACAIPIAGTLADKIGRRPVMFAAAGLFFALSFPLFKGLSSGNWTVALLSQITFGVLMGINWAPIPAVLSEQFPSNVRCSGIAIAHNLSMALFGGTAPEIVTWLLKTNPSSIAIPGIYLMVASVFSMIGILKMKDCAQKKLT